MTQATKATIATVISSYVEDFQMSLIEGETPTCSGESMKTYIPSLQDTDLNNFVIINGELYYIGSGTQELEIAESYGINISLANCESDIIEIVSTILTSSTKSGIALYDKNSLHSEDWGVVTDYDEDYEQTGKYGTGYYYLSSGTYTIDEKEITVTGNYIIDYENLNLIPLSSKYVFWSINSTIAVTNGLVLNIDPSNLTNIEYKEITVTDDAVAVANGEESATAYQLYEDGKDTGITMYGDVLYDENNNSLVFNESNDNPLITEDGDTAGGGYIKLLKDDNSIDFSNGFTFEIYANLSRLEYDNGLGLDSTYTSDGLGLFSRMDNLYGTCTQSMRFGHYYGILGKFSSSLSLNANSVGFDINTDFYLTFVYEVGEGRDKMSYYIDGALLYSRTCDHELYEDGLEYWNYSDYPFFLGVCAFGANGNLYYLKGSVYATRLYTYSMTEEEVYQNRALTLTYRASFT